MWIGKVLDVVGGGEDMRLLLNPACAAGAGRREVT
jgi:hypothetical protein